jgi:hypothetical protein
MVTVLKPLIIGSESLRPECILVYEILIHEAGWLKARRLSS